MGLCVIVTLILLLGAIPGAVFATADSEAAVFQPSLIEGTDEAEAEASLPETSEPEAPPQPDEVPHGDTSLSNKEDASLANQGEEVGPDGDGDAADVDGADGEGTGSQAPFVNAKDSGGFEYADTIDLSARSDSVQGDGYTVYGGPAWAYDNRFLETKPTGLLAFNEGANGKTYHIIQTGTPKAGVESPNGPKYGTSMVAMITVATGVDVRLVISGIDLIGSITLTGTAHVELLLDGTNNIRRTVAVPADAKITIDSLSGSDSDGRLVITSAPGATDADASIGGTWGNRSGSITVNGGTIDITARSSGAGIGGGGAPNAGGYAAKAGKTTINGGIVSVAQYGSTNATAAAISGAGIGGGGGSASYMGGDAGDVLVTGGTVTVRQYTRAAGIGGGTFGAAGNITIEGGTVDVEVVRLTNLSGAGEGAGIGNAAGSNLGTGAITISGGTVRSVAFMTGIGRVNSVDGSAKFTITITGGTVFAQGTQGPGIGFWSSSAGGMITMTGGTVVAQSAKDAGIGAAVDNNTGFCLGELARVKAYAGGACPAINTKDNAGEGYYVNASLNVAPSNTAETLLQVFAEGKGQPLLKTLALPAAYRHFAYSTDASRPRTDNIYAHAGTVALGTVVRVADDSMQIYSVKTRAGYNAHNPVPDTGALPVKLDGASFKAERYIVTRDRDNRLVGSYHWLADAVGACGPDTDGAFTITATEDDADMTDRLMLDSRGPIPTSGADASIAIPSDKAITLHSGAGGPFTIKQMGMDRHFWVYGSLTVENVILEGIGLNPTRGNAVNGGIEVAGTLAMGAGGAIQKCYAENGGAIQTGDYANLKVAKDAVFRGNAALEGIDLGLSEQEYATLFPTIASIYGNGYSAHPSLVFKHPVNGYDINVLDDVIRQRATTLTVSKAVTGAMGNKETTFGFTVYFETDSGEPLPTGREFGYTITGADGHESEAGVLRLQGDGSCAFALKHGQSIEITGVPLNSFIRVVETPEAGYVASFVDSLTPLVAEQGNDTGGKGPTPEMREMSPGRAFDFTNDRAAVPEGGIPDVGTVPLLCATAALVLLAFLLARNRRKA
ncbi:MAG: hypothetical protein FWD72_02910 [Eggerthellaceae bacterium]|nr:hypothetical protein [Eggerthellaceae bacterium]